LLKLRVTQRGGVDSDPLVLQELVALDAGVVSGEQLWVGALAQVVKERVALGQVLLGGVELVGFGERSHGLIDGLLAGLEGLELDVANHEALERMAQLRRTLDRCHSPDRSLGLDVLEHRLGVGVT
jgi:hypothetical protein